MTTIRKLIYKIQLNMDDGKTPIITIATSDKHRLPELIDKNKLWFEQYGQKVLSWKFIEEFLTFGMNQEQYEEEISFCDIVDEIE